ncbi:hypothetical protein FQN60_015819 [Etheostoma spectabile]|uniref:Uncharacterized protein n=1 Tax=Etheostoma spectabile TaxID=54343 RepID=A0A5J5CR34_9PERO|nr:hypothetical protein FQN60_015819 [Etheostoma spectabile]
MSSDLAALMKRVPSTNPEKQMVQIAPILSPSSGIWTGICLRWWCSWDLAVWSPVS